MPLQKLTYVLIIAAAITTLVTGVEAADFEFPLAALGFIAWSLAPYLYLMGLNKLVSAKAAIIATFVATLLISVFGLALLIDAMFIHPDAQSGLVFIFAPLWQLLFLLLITIPLYFLNRTKKT
jgi:hypothetical protein